MNVANLKMMHDPSPWPIYSKVHEYPSAGTFKQASQTQPLLSCKLTPYSNEGVLRLEEDHLKELLEILEKYPQTEIALTLSNQLNIPYAIIKYEKRAFVLFDLKEKSSTLYTDFWALLPALQKFWHDNKKLAGA
jgi:hypothetical protein